MNVKKYKALMERVQEVDQKIKNIRKEIDKKKDECSVATSVKKTPEYKQRIIAELENKLNKVYLYIYFILTKAIIKICFNYEI